ncbi:U3 small nucleolar ribonucleoprotein protein MPP10-like [Pongo abelii]|uniref:U3 small nucleolar ribonucleoprotein protein MPP10-like n=1 Tax=Pongo abelii TaxID=9601 RepID=UPI0030065524
MVLLESQLPAERPGGKEVEHAASTRIQDGFASKFTSLTKVLYDFNKIVENGRIHGSSLQKLVIESFADEQTLQQLELQNEAILQSFQNAVSETKTKIPVFSQRVKNSSMKRMVQRQRLMARST